jgi:ubiquinone/menaquinone biosynthesis C-methylase UbiE
LRVSGNWGRAEAFNRICARARHDLGADLVSTPPVGANRWRPDRSCRHNRRIGRPPDPLFSDRRLAATYDVFEGDRNDLDAYERIVDELAARRVLDVGCGTGEFACRLARRGIAVTAVDPAQASVEIARTKPGAEDVTWIVGDATTLPPLHVELATMTANVAQVFVDDEEWTATLEGIRRTLSSGGHLVFETRQPSRKAWLEWTPDLTRQRAELHGGEVVETWCEVTAVDGELVTFRWTNHFESDGATVVSDSTLRFRSRAAIERSLDAAGYDLVDVRDAPDRPGREMVFIARTR